MANKQKPRLTERIQDRLRNIVTELTASLLVAIILGIGGLITKILVDLVGTAQLSELWQNLIEWLGNISGVFLVAMAMLVIVLALIANILNYSLTKLVRKVWPVLWQQFVGRYYYPAKSIMLGSQVDKPTPLPSPRGNAVLIRGMASRPGDETFQKLESKLAGANIAVTRFSYKGPQSPEYEPFDTINDMRLLVSYLDQYVRGSRGDIPLYLLGYSLGGLIIANWICRSDGPPDHLELVNKVDKVFLFAAPLFPPSPSVPIEHPEPDVGEVEYFLAPYDYDVNELLDRFSRVVVLIGEKDPIAPREYASLVSQDTWKKPLDEVEIPASHLDICNHDKAVETVMHWISQE